MKAVTITCDCRCECHNPAIGTTIAPMLCGSTIESWGGDCRNACRAGWRCNDPRLALNLQIKTQHIQPGWTMHEPGVFLGDDE